MKRSIARRASAAGIAALVTIALAGCATPSETDSGGVTTITIGDVPTADQPEKVQLVKDRVAEFEAANPDIKIELSEATWTPTTFQAMVAGGTMPTLMAVAFTEPSTLIRNGQIADITDELKSSGMLDTLNPAVLKVVQDSDQRTYGVPVDVYSVGLAYNRALFTAAGLDPEKPPTTWDEVREYAKKISAATGVAGYSTYSIEHTGGWMTTAAGYSYGAELATKDGSQATLNSPELKEYLELVQKMRWDDQSMGNKFLYGFSDLVQDFAAGKVGMFMSASQHYPMAVQQFGMQPADYGFTGLPQEGSNNSTLLGGAVKVFSKTATSAQISAGLRWLQFETFDKFENEASAVKQAKQDEAAGLLIGVPGLSPLSDKTFDSYQSWVSPYYNVPVAQFSGYTDVMNDQKLVPEPTSQPQQVYAELDTVIQSVLTEQNSDLNALLDAATKNVNAKLGR